MQQISNILILYDVMNIIDNVLYDYWINLNISYLCSCVGIC